MIETQRGSKKSLLSDLYGMDYQKSGPWLRSVEQVKVELQDMAALKSRNTVLVEKQKTLDVQMVQMKKECQELTLINKQIEKKLSTSLAKAERSNAMEIELDDLKAKLGSVSTQVTKVQNELERSKKDNENLRKKLEEAKKVQVA